MTVLHNKEPGSEDEGRARPPAVPSLRSNQSLRSRLGGNASPYLDPAERSTRKVLGHSGPSWVSTTSIFFVTICVNDRRDAPLLQMDRAARLIASVKFLHDRGDWFARLFLIMPDHVHGLIAFPSTGSLAHRVAAWKGYTHKTIGIEWQERFFDHRLRSDEGLEEKADYIRMNPVRAGIARTSKEWPWMFDALATNAARPEASPYLPDRSKP